RPHHLTGQGHGPTSAHHTYPVARLHAERGCQVRVDFQKRLRILPHQGANATRLRATQVLRDYPAGGEEYRILGVDVLSRWTILDSVEPRPTISMIECPTVEESRCTRMRGLRAWPEDTVLLVDLLIGDAVIVTEPTTRHAAQLAKDILDAGIGKVLPGGQT